MAILSQEAEKELINKLFALAEEKLKEHEKNNPVSDLVQQKQLLEELGISYTTLKRFEALGLKRLTFDDNSRTVLYSRRQLAEVFNNHAY